MQQIDSGVAAESKRGFGCVDSLSCCRRRPNESASMESRWKNAGFGHPELIGRTVAVQDLTPDSGRDATGQL